MSDKRPLTIQFFLPEGEPRGIRGAGILRRSVEDGFLARSELILRARRSGWALAGVCSPFHER